MFDSIKNFALEKGYALARKKGVNCPDCGTELELPVQMPEGGLEASFSCHSCSWTGGLTDAFIDSRDGRSSKNLLKPQDSRVVEGYDHGGQSWTIPARMRPNFFWFFSIFWLGITGFMTFMFLFGEMKDADTGEVVSPIFGLFFVPFWAVGLGTLYAAVRSTFLHQTISIGQGKVTLTNTLFGREKHKSIDLHNVKSISREVAYRQNNRPVYNVTVKAKEGKNLKFGNSLANDDKAWVVSQLSKALKVDEPTSSSSSVKGRDSDRVGKHELDEINEKGIQLKRLTATGFKLNIEHRCGPLLLFIALVFGGVSVVLLSNAYHEFSSSGNGSTIFELVSGLFSLVPALIGLAFIAVAIVLLSIGLHYWGLEKKYEFGENEVIVKIGKKGRSPKTSRLSRTSFTAVKKSSSGNVNNEPRYKVSLQGTKPLTVVGFAKPAVAEELEQWLLHWIQSDQLSSYGSSMKVD